MSIHTLARYEYYNNGKPIYYFSEYISTIDIPYRRYTLTSNMNHPYKTQQFTQTPMNTECKENYVICHKPVSTKYEY